MDHTADPAIRSQHRCPAPGPTQFARSPFGRSRPDGQRAQLGKPRGPSV